MKAKIYNNHIGFLPLSRKRFVLPDCNYNEFVIQDMQQIESAVLGQHEEWKTVYEGILKKHKTDFGAYLTGDFSDIHTSGLYRIKILGTDLFSYQFVISNKAFHQLPFLFLDFIHNWRSGKHGLNWREASNLDDAKRSDNGKQIDVSGGWYDAGDLRKWMVHSNLPVLGFLDIYKKLSFQRNHWGEEKLSDNDFISESIWALKYIVKMQDSETGMFFEDVAGGGNLRCTNNSSWWYENHAGVIADNSENHFTDNIPDSGDERTVRVQYNPIAQYTSITILLSSFKFIKAQQPELSQKCQKTALKCWSFMEKKLKDNYHKWTSIKAWRLMSGINMWKLGHLQNEEISDMLSDLLSIYNYELGFWWMSEKKNDFYRGILHSAQPIIAIIHFYQLGLDNELNNKIESILKNTWDTYIKPLSETNPFGFIPYGVYLSPANKIDLFRKWKGKWYRNFMPDNSPQNINHGLSGHWMSWAHALSLMAKVLHNDEIKNAAFDQIYWLTGNNPYNSSVITGVGYNQAMPHSRYLGNFPGGFMTGFIGLQDDMPYLDTDGNAQWNTTEYWNTPNANCSMALSELLS